MKFDLVLPFRKASEDLTTKADDRQRISASFAPSSGGQNQADTVNAAEEFVPAMLEGESSSFFTKSSTDIATRLFFVLWILQVLLLVLLSEKNLIPVACIYLSC